ncbi:MAG: hypothetical protein KDC34_18780 [Saprospiraceae bacterium]|nr:hypothetical protein [Saprospiraceae bacterium]
MHDYLINFEALEWEKPQKGVAQKIFSDGAKRIRLLRFSDEFVETDWCMKGHVGYVLAGEMLVDFNGTLKRFKTGDGLWINEGAPSKHKVSIEKGKQVELILFESA